MKKLYVNVRYLIVPVMTVATIVGLYFGGIYAWIGVFLFGFNTILDTLTKDTPAIAVQMNIAINPKIFFIIFFLILLIQLKLLDPF